MKTVINESSGKILNKLLKQFFKAAMFLAIFLTVSMVSTLCANFLLIFLVKETNAQELIKLIYSIFIGPLATYIGYKCIYQQKVKNHEK